MQTMDYLFFNHRLAVKFQKRCEEFITQVHIQTEFTPSDGDAYSVVITGDISEENCCKIENIYDELFFGEQAALIEGNCEDGSLADSCGVQVKLSTGEYTTIKINPTIMNKILSVLTTEELQQFLSQVAEDVEFPKNAPICKNIS